MKIKLYGFIVAIVFVAVIITVAIAQQPKGPGFSAPTSTPSGWYSKSYALVVGINKYTNGWGRLDAAVNDARAVASVLKEQGFQVTELYDQQATKYNIVHQLSTVLPAKVKAGDRFVFYYSGHGQTEITAKGAQLGYIVPFDGRALGGDDFASYISMVELKSIFSRKYAAKHVLAVFDSCFSGLMLARSGVMSGTVNSTLNKTGVNVLTAGGQGEQAVDGLFARKLLDGLRGNADSNNDSYITFSELGVYVQQQVPAENPKQAPTMGWLDGEGQIVFARGAYKQLPPPTAVTPVPEIAPKGMVKIPGGWFFMGCVPGDNRCHDAEKPRKRVYIDTFYMDVHEVTVAEYQLCVESGTCNEAKETDHPQWGNYYNWNKVDRANHPINGVDWNDANAYCRFMGKQLPTEAQFEYVLRGGSDSLIYPWGNSNSPPLNYGNYADESAKERFEVTDMPIIRGYKDGYAGSSPICSMQQNKYGLCDISGNLGEWCQDWYSKDWYSEMPERNPVNYQKSTAHIVRGGSWDDTSDSVRASNRYGLQPHYRTVDTGFRCSSKAE